MFVAAFSNVQARLGHTKVAAAIGEHLARALCKSHKYILTMYIFFIHKDYPNLESFLRHSGPLTE